MLSAMDEDLTPLGELLETARLAKRPKLSQNAVAKAADTSATTYRRIIRGVSRFGGQDVPFEGADETVARIADVLGVTPEQLEQVGRPGAAEELRAARRPRRPLHVVAPDVRGSGAAAGSGHLCRPLYTIAVECST